MKEDVEIHGLDELEKKFGQLEVATSRKALRSALHWSAKPMYEAMRDSDVERKGGDFFKLKNRRLNLKTLTKRWLSRDGKTDNYSAQVNVGYRMRGVWYIPINGIKRLTELEFGTKDKAPLGWMRRAAELTWKEVAERFGMRLAKRFKKLEEKK